MREWNEKQTRIAKNWSSNLLEFLRREWRAAFLWTAAGATLGFILRFVAYDRLVIDPVTKKAQGYGVDSAAAYAHANDLKLLGAIFLVAGFCFSLPWIYRGMRSWWTGSTSGLKTWSALSGFLLFVVPGDALIESAFYGTGLTLGFWCFSFGLHLRSQIRSVRTVKQADLRVRARSVRDSASWASIADEPIQTWEEDVLGRAAVVDIITQKALIGRTPVIALSGPLGIGKSSVLNLLESHLKDKAIVVRFVAWLPGSQDVLSSYLFADIATECQKRYVVPGLRRSSRRVAKALAETIPVFKGVLEFLPATSQRDDLIALGVALARLPERVIVLLDELDRMQKEEILTLLKMLRGILSLPNCTFVCALDLDEIMQTVRGNKDEATERFFEKFFPVTVPLPRLSEATLQRAGVRRVVQAFQREEWFRSEEEATAFEDVLSKVWMEMVAPLCGTLRGIGLLATDLDVAASLLRRQVNPLDLTLIEVLRRFQNAVYDVISENRRPLTGGENWIRSAVYISDERKKREEDHLKAALEAALVAKDAEPVKAILKYLFPSYTGLDSRHWRPGKQHEEGDDLRISDPEMFSAYFQYELPEGVFSSLELDAFLDAFRQAADDGGRTKVYEAVLKELPKQSLKRDDFLRKLGISVRDMSKEEAVRLALTAVREAKEYTYDMFAGFGEAGHVLRIVIRAAEMMPQQERVPFLRRCIELANDDTLALRVLVNLTGKSEDVRLGVTHDELRPAFLDRMRRQYGEHVDAEMDLSASDPQAFHQWGWTHPDAPRDSEDRRLQQSFWLRRIGQSRKRLAAAFDTFLMPRGYMYSNDPSEFVAACISLQELARLVEELPHDEELSAEETNSLERVTQLLGGDFKNGVPMI